MKSEGTWEDGACSGDAIERSAAGGIMFLGKYRDGVRHGEGILNMEVKETDFLFHSADEQSLPKNILAPRLICKDKVIIYIYC